MYILLLVISFLGSLLAISEIFKGELSGLKNYFNRIIPFQGWIGIGLLFFSFKSFIAIANGVLFFEFYFLAFSRFIIGFFLAYNLLEKSLFANSLNFSKKARKVKNEFKKIQLLAGIVLFIYTSIAIYNYIKILILFP